MPDINSSESLMTWIINRFSQAFPDHAVLKGGMALRLLDCPRYTNDLDYIFVPFKSKKEIVSMIDKVLHELEGADFQYSMNSKCLRYIVKYQDYSTQIEINVSLECKTQPLSTAALAAKNNQLPHIIKIMSFDWALAHKLAAWNERNLARDLYDIYFLHSVLDEMPDLKVLNKRLMNINFRNKNTKQIQSKQMSIPLFLDKLESAIKDIDETTIQNQLNDYMQPEEMAGLDKKIKIGIKSLIEKIRHSPYTE